MRHFGQVGHHGVAAYVFAQADGQQRFGFVVDLRAQNFAELDRLAFGVGQLQRHVVFAGYGLDDADGHQAECARQVFGQVDHLRALDAGGRLDLVARDHRARGGGHHAHFNTEVTQLLFNQARGHLQRFRRDGFLAQQGAVEQVHLRQLGVQHVRKQRLLALFGHAFAFGYVHQRGLYQHRDGLMVFDVNALFNQDFFALARRRTAHSQVFGEFAFFTARVNEVIDPGAYALGSLRP